MKGVGPDERQGLCSCTSSVLPHLLEVLDVMERLGSREMIPTSAFMIL